ncbi:hypothetical protein [Sulfurospirillum cavolei]|uniref:hypothetical protein n=1 Tax=Sulfurospirillum cavolei TaxID=366522 RepID=UPI0005A8FF50|nr:hypothetical protein [Sulfurospirillum cavolei]
MNDEMNYLFIPTFYAISLQKHGQRAKARAFFEYFLDLRTKHENALSFYARSWDVGKTTAHRWVEEFRNEIDKFHELWNTHNDKKMAERFYFHSGTIDTSETSNFRGLEKNGGTTEFLSRNQELILNDDDNAHTRENDYDESFEKLFMMAMRHYKFAGNKQEAYAEYKRHYPHIQPKDMAYAYKLHVKDPLNRGKIYNLANFMHNDVHASYLNPYLKIQLDGQTFEGWYDKDTGIFTTDDHQYVLTKDRFYELMKRCQIELLNQMRAPRAHQ